MRACSRAYALSIETNLFRYIFPISFYLLFAFITHNTFPSLTPLRIPCFPPSPSLTTLPFITSSPEDKTEEEKQKTLREEYLPQTLGPLLERLEQQLQGKEWFVEDKVRLSRSLINHN